MENEKVRRELNLCKFGYDEKWTNACQPYTFCYH